MVDELTVDSENTLMPDGDEDSAIADGDVVTADDDATTGDPSDSDKTQKRVEDTQSALKEMQKEYHKMSTDIAELRGIKEALLAQNTQPVKKEPDWLDATDLDEQFDENPSGTVKKMMSRLRGDVASVFDERDSHLLERVEKIVAEAVNPARTELSSELSELSGIEGFKNLDQKTQIALAEKIRKAKPRQTAKAPTSVAGTGTRVPAQKNDDAQKAIDAASLALFGDKSEDSEILNLEEV